jgi:hypothetical protein
LKNNPTRKSLIEQFAEKAQTSYLKRLIGGPVFFTVVKQDKNR